MNIFYDHQAFTLQKYGGISRYFYQIIKGIDKLNDYQLKTDVSLLISDNYYISNDNKFNHIRFFQNYSFRGKKRIERIINKCFSIKNLYMKSADLVHATYYDPYFVKYLGNVPYVITVHDMIHEKFEDMFPRTDRSIEQKKLTIKNANKIIAISENTKKDIIDIYGVSEEKISVIYHGNSMRVPFDTTLPNTFPKKYILYVGDRSRYKNFKLFLESVVSILQDNDDLNLICIGGGEFKRSENIMFNIHEISSKLVQYNANDDELAILYTNAAVFVFPSLYEGFGIPILEAFACKCPLVCSNTSSFPEIAKDAAVYFDPNDESSITNAIKKVLEDEELRKKIIEKGTIRLEDFSWERAVVQTLDVYKRIAKVI